MTFFKRKRKANQVYRVKTEIISSYYDGTGGGPQYVTRFFLAKKRKDKYYELFSGTPLKLKEDCNCDGMFTAKFDVPYIVEVVSMSQYSYKKELTDSELFYYITKINAINDLELDEDEPDEDFEEEMSEEE